MPLPLVIIIKEGFSRCIVSSIYNEVSRVLNDLSRLYIMKYREFLMVCLALILWFGLAAGNMHLNDSLILIQQWRKSLAGGLI